MVTVLFPEAVGPSMARMGTGPEPRAAERSQMSMR